MISRLAIYSLLILLTACGGGGGSSDSAPTTRNAHEPGWLSTHDTDALEAQAEGDLTECQVCHRRDLRGGEGVPSCFQCHILTADFDPENPRLFLHPPALFAQDEAGNIHIAQWANPINHGRSAKRDIRQCQGCHGRPGGPGDNPRFDVTLRTLDNGCESTQCHGGNQAGDDRTNVYFDLVRNEQIIDEVAHNPRAAHPASGGQDDFFWFAHPIDLDADVGLDGFDLDGEGIRDDIYLGHFDIDRSACTLCHGVVGDGGVGPACSVCHLQANPIQQTTPCFSCHSGPPAGSTTLVDFFASNAPLPPGAPVDSRYFQSYIQNFETANHAQHVALPSEARSETADCQECHTRNSSTRHHQFIGQIIPAATYAREPEAAQDADGNFIYTCETCHVLIPDPNGGFQFGSFRQCVCCHYNRSDASQLTPIFPADLPLELQREAICEEF